MLSCLWERLQRPLPSLLQGYISRVRKGQHLFVPVFVHSSRCYYGHQQGSVCITKSAWNRCLLHFEKVNTEKATVNRNTDGGAAIYSGNMRTSWGKRNADMKESPKHTQSQEMENNEGKPTITKIVLAQERIIPRRTNTAQTTNKQHELHRHKQQTPQNTTNYTKLRQTTKKHRTNNKLILPNQQTSTTQTTNNLHKHKQQKYTN